MYRLLRDGVEILKHGRRGAPKFKTLFCDANMTKLYWRAQGSRPDGNLDNLAEDASYYPTLLDPTAPAASLALGVDVTAATPSSGAPRLPFGGKSNADRVLYIRDIKEVRVWGVGGMCSTQCGADLCPGPVAGARGLRERSDAAVSGEGLRDSRLHVHRLHSVGGPHAGLRDRGGERCYILC